MVVFLPSIRLVSLLRCNCFGASSDISDRLSLGMPILAALFASSLPNISRFRSLASEFNVTIFLGITNATFVVLERVCLSL